MAARKKAAKKSTGATAPVDPAKVAKRLGKIGGMASLAIQLRPAGFLSTGMRTVDLALSGGLPKQRVSHGWGDSSTGKTALGLWMARRHLLENPEGLVIILDTERALSGDFAGLMMQGVDMGRVIVLEPNTAEECFEMIETACAEYNGIEILIIWDSVAATLAKAEAEDSYDSKTPAQFARTMSRGIKKIRPIVTASTATVLVLNQNRERIGGMVFGDPKKPCGGNALTFHTDLSFRLYRTLFLRPKPGADPFGIQVRLKIDKTRVGLPARECKFRMYFTLGVMSDLEEVYDMAKRYGLAEKAGSGVAVCDVQYGSKREFALALKDDPMLFDTILLNIRAAMFPQETPLAVVETEE